MPDAGVNRREEIESFVTDWLNENDVPGASVVIVDEAGERYAEGFGARDLESNAPATPDTLFGMGSITKSVTALAVLQLDEAGTLSVDDAVDEYVPHYADVPGEPITVRELLSHTSGMPANPVGLFKQSLEGYPSGVADEADLERWVRDSTDFRATDRERFFYYNTGYDVLGRVVEAVDGRPYADYVDAEIFEPLGLDRATFDPDVFDEDDDVMTGYRPGDDDEPPEPNAFPLSGFERPAGGLIASARELTVYLRAMMTDGSVGAGRVCSPEAVERLQRARAVRQAFLDGTDQEYGYGWIRQPLGTDEAIGHGGSILVATSYAGYLVDAGLGVVVACNTATEPHTAALGMAILALLSGGDVTDVPAYAMEAKCEAVTGTYEAFREEFTVSVEREGGGLAVTFEGGLIDQQVRSFPATLDPTDHEFYTVTGAGVRAPLEFDLSGERADLYFQRHRCRRTGPER